MLKHRFISFIREIGLHIRSIGAKFIPLFENDLRFNQFFEKSWWVALTCRPCLLTRHILTRCYVKNGQIGIACLLVLEWPGWGVTRPTRKNVYTELIKIKRNQLDPSGSAFALSLRRIKRFQVRKKAKKPLVNWKSNIRFLTPKTRRSPPRRKW